MGAKSDALAKQLEAKSQQAMATLEQLSEADWKKVTEAETWSVGVTAHHLAGALEPISNMVKAVAAGQSLSSFRLDTLDERNAKHAKDHANCTKAETIALHEKGTAAAAAAIRGLSDDQLTKSGTLAAGAPPMTTEQVITAALLDHIDEHFGSIRKTVGHPAGSADRELVITRLYNAPRSLVLKAWTDPKHVAQWWGPHGFTNPLCELDVRPGGAIRIHMRGPDGTLYPMTGVYQEIVQPERLVFLPARRWTKRAIRSSRC